VKVLITGASGFVGRHLVAKLMERGHSVRAMVHTDSSVAEFRDRGIEACTADVRDPEALDQVVRGCDTIYHLAAKTTKSSLSKKEFYQHNVAGTVNLAHAALKAGVERFVYGGSIGVYGTTRNLAIDENTRPSPDSYYRETKFEAEQAVLGMHKEAGLPAVVARLGTTYGPGSLSLLDLCRKLTRTCFRMIGNGENHLDTVYIDDLIDGLWRCGETPNVEGRVYVLKGAEPITVNRFLEMLRSHIAGRARLGSLPAAPFWIYRKFGRLVYRLAGIEVPRVHYYDLFLTDHIFLTTRARNDLDYCPGTRINEGVSQLIRWYRQEGLLAD
jgi:2-alkyl-3-oxoalkanoate reductase